MPNGIGPISKKAFAKLPAKERDVIQYEYIIQVNGAILKLSNTVAKLEKKFQRKNFFDKGASFVGGIFGGAFAFVSSKIFGVLE